MRSASFAIGAFVALAFSTSSIKMNLPDDRFGLKVANLCDADPWEILAGNAVCKLSTPAKPCECKGEAAPADVDALVKEITDEIMKQVK